MDFAERVVVNKKAGNGKKQSRSDWYAETFEILEEYAAGQIPGTETIAKITRLKSRDNGAEHIAFEKWGTDGGYIKHFMYPAVRSVVGLLVDATKGMGAIPAETTFLLATANKKGKGKQ